jgi:hypothetical protein
MPDSPALPASLRWAVGILLGEAAGVAVIAAILGYGSDSGKRPTRARHCS